MSKKLLTILSLWLTIAVTGAWANARAELQSGHTEKGISNPLLTAESGEGVADELQMNQGNPQRMPQRAPKDDYVYKYKGVKYTYITENNYTRYFNTSVHKPSDYGWYTDKEGWYVNAEKAYITAASIDADDFPSSGEVYILNDLVGLFSSHTHLGCIADNGFRFMPGVRRVYFQDCDAMSYTANTDFYFFIGDKAFADCENLEEVNMMQWTTSGDNHWETLPPTAVKRLWGSMLDNSPKAWIRVGTSVYQQYLGSQTWVPVRDRITTFEHSSDDITVNGAVYSFLKAEDGSALSNADEQHEEIMKTLRLWNADYQNFNAASLLSDKSRTPDNANIWYTTVTGADASYLKKNDGVLRIYNDPGSYYNYKTIAIRKGAFENCDDLKAVEFWQTNGRSDNSYSDLRMVIENGAFKNCKNLEEIRLFYKVEDGTDRWQVLGPENIIPGNDIFGYDSMTEEEFRETTVKVRFIVSPERYTDFLADPNWALYVPFIEAADYMPTVKEDIVRDGLTYKYSAAGSGLYSTDQVVTQGVSWWSAPLIAAEVALTIATLGHASTAANVAAAAAESMKEVAFIEGSKSTFQSALAFFRYGVENAMKYVVQTLGGERIYNIAAKELMDVYIYAGIINKATGTVVSSAFLEEIAESYIRQFIITYITLITEESAKALAKAQAIELMASTLKYNVIKEVISSQLISGAFCSYMALRGNSDVSTFGDGMKANIIANMHQVGMTGLIVTTPSKDLIYHTYVSNVADDVTEAKIYISPDDEERTVAISQKAFQNKKNLQTVTFHENDDVNSHEMTAMCMAIADSAFVGCTGLRSLDLRLYTKKNGIRALGPEHFILCGNDLFASLDSTQFHIIVAEERLQDFIEDRKWGQFKRFFTAGKIEEKVQYTEFGVKYAFSTFCVPPS